MTGPSPHALKALEALLSTQSAAIGCGADERGEGNAEATVSCNSILLHDCLALVRKNIADLPPTSP